MEREIKLRVDDDFEMPELPGEPLLPIVFTSTYHDTVDYRLARGAITLRRRVHGDSAAWQLKVPGGGAIEVPDDSSAPPGRLTDILIAHTRGEALVPAVSLRASRVGWRVKDRGVVADVMADTVWIVDPDRARGPFRELEIELIHGDDKALARIERALRGAGARDGDPRPKVFQALGLHLPGAPTTPSPDAPGPMHLEVFLRRQLSALLAHDPGTRLGHEPETVHRMRVAIRRLRAVLRAARRMLDPPSVDQLRHELEWLGDLLKPVRDGDVQLAYLRSEAATLDREQRIALESLLDQTLERERDAVRQMLLDGLRSARYFALLDRLESAARCPMFTAPHLSLAAIAGKQFKRLRKAVRRLAEEPTDEDVHRVRIKAKRARYAAELAEPVVGARARRFIRKAKALENVLGEHQDAVVAEARIRLLASRTRDVQAGIAAGRLLERQRVRRDQARDGFPKAWTKLEKRGREAWT